MSEFKLFISLLDPKDTDRVFSFLKSKKLKPTNFLTTYEVYNPKTGNDEKVFLNIKDNCIYDENILGATAGYTLYKNLRTDEHKFCEKVISYLKESEFPYFMAVVFNDEGYCFYVDHGHLISRANNHIEEIVSPPELESIIDNIVAKRRKPQKKTVAKRVAKKTNF